MCLTWGFTTQPGGVGGIHGVCADTFCWKSQFIDGAVHHYAKRVIGMLVDSSRSRWVNLLFTHKVQGVQPLHYPVCLWLPEVRGGISAEHEGQGQPGIMTLLVAFLYQNMYLNASEKWRVESDTQASGIKLHWLSVGWGRTW